ncbi:MAG: sugar transferase [Leptolyngbyaceae cyanobacterium CSU_1_3]|nr:sugar transferase [Leptolyngbyaceae cyanobacterium CSU_1_3]
MDVLGARTVPKSSGTSESSKLTSAFILGSPHPSTTSVLKRCVDVVGSLIGLWFLAIIYLPIVVAIKLNSPGPVFYSQIRCGLQGKTFRLRKFRSMVSNAEDLRKYVKNEGSNLFFKNNADPRVTKVGQFLRKTSLDEFPQFWNVLIGDMSLVGTRPPLPDETAHYSPRHWQRLHVKPGITGEWQVSGRSDVKDFEQVLDLDLKYQDCWSVLYDLKIILKTLQVVFVRKGAY